MISQNLLAELQTIFIEDYGIRLQSSEALEIANNLVKYFEILLKVDLSVKKEKHD